MGITLLIPFLLLCGCSSLQFANHGQIPVYVTKREGHHDYVEIKGKKEFFLWGLIGEDKKVFIDELMKEKGIISVANIHLETYMSPLSIFQTIFSLGLYIPKEFKIKAFGVSLDPETRHLKRKGF